MKTPTDKDRWHGDHQLARFGRAILMIDKRRASRAAAVEAQARLSREIVDPDLLSKEKYLQESVFPSYQYMTPYERTDLFARDFQRAKRVYLKKKRGINPVGDYYHRLAYLLDGTISGMWAARQEFDRLGISYAKPIFWLMDKALEDKLPYLPMPNQLFTNKALSEVRYMWMHKGWWERAAEDAFGSDNFGKPADPRFLACNYVGAQQQIRALDFIEHYVRNGQAGDANHRLGHMLLGQKVISEAEAIKRFGAEAVARACVTVDDEIDEIQLPVDTEHPPNCVGYGPDLTMPVCVGCPAHAACASVAAAVDAQLVTAYGSTDPRAVKKREANREHQRQSRARKKLRSKDPEV